MKNNITIDDLTNFQEGIQAVISLLQRTTTGNLAHKKGNCLCILRIIDEKLNKFILKDE